MRLSANGKAERRGNPRAWAFDPGCCPLATAGERFALIKSNCRCWGPNGVFEWVWRAGALRMGREILAGGRPLRSKTGRCSARRWSRPRPALGSRSGSYSTTICSDHGWRALAALETTTPLQHHWVLETRTAKKKGPGGPGPEVLQKDMSLHGRYGPCPLRLYGLSHYTALARELMFRNEIAATMPTLRADAANIFSSTNVCGNRSARRITAACTFSLARVFQPSSRMFMSL